MPVIMQFFKSMNPIKLAIVGVGVLGFILLFFFYIAKISSTDMALLYSDLEMEDSSKIVQELDSKKIAYQLFDDGKVIKVPRDEVSRVRVTLAQSGLPNKGSIVGYEIFDKEDSIGTTNFSQNVKMSRALEGEIARTIASFDQVDKVRVHLVLPQKEIFSKERLEPRASIVIRFKNNKSFTKTEIEAVSHFIVSAVAGLEIKNLTIVDSKGHSLKIGAREDEAEFAIGRNEEYRIAYENRLKKTIEDLLEHSIGAGKAKAQVAVEMNFDRVVTNIESYDPDNAVARSVQTLDERESSPVGGEDNTDISVANNIPNSSQEQSNKNLAISEKSEQTTNYEISKTVKNQITETGRIVKLSIGVIVDGLYKVDLDEKTVHYLPRTQTEIDQITNLVKVAVGFDAERHDRIEVVNMQFTTDLDAFLPESTDNWLKEELPNLFQTLVFAVVVVLVLVTVVRPITLKAFELKRGTSDLIGNEENRAGIDVSTLDQTRSTMGGTTAYADGRDPNVPIERSGSKAESNNQRINEYITFYPQEMLNVLRKWLDEGK